MVHRVDITSPDFQNDPYRAYAELRNKSPICQVDPGGMWAVSRHADIQFVLKHPELFSSSGFRATFVVPWLPDYPILESMLLKDPPEHTKLRGLVNHAFGPREMTRLTLRVQAIVAEIVGRIEPGRDTDFVKVFADPLLATIIAHLFGLDPGRYQDFSRWVTTINTVTPATPSSQHASIQEAIAEMSGYLFSVIEARRRTPTDDMIGDLVRADIEGYRLSDYEIVAFFYLLIGAGIGTTSGLLSNMMLALLEDPDLHARLRAEPAMLPRFIEEMIRHNSPVQAVFRQATIETEIASVVIPEGAFVVCLLGSGNRDALQFPDPDRIDLSRNCQGVLSFGHGVHFCIGASLARLTARLAYEALFARFSGFTQAPGEVERSKGLVTRGLNKLPLRFLPA